MGVMRFVVHPPELPLDWPEHQMAYVSGFDGRIFPTFTELDGEIFSCRRSFSDSGNVSVPYPVKGFGRPTLSTTSLREREEPYFLPLELARGKISQIRDQSATWSMARMAIPEEFEKTEREAFQAFAHASANQHDRDECARAAHRALEVACHASELLSDAYVRQRMISIRRSASHPPSLLGAILDSSVLTEPGKECFLDTFNAACIPVRWSDVEAEEGRYNWEPFDQLARFCAENKIIARGGPLISLGKGGLPKWLAPWSSDFLNLVSFVCDFIDTAVSRYTGRIRIWEVSSGGNYGGVFDLSEEQCLSLVARTLEAAMRTDSDSQFFIRVEQPWGEYQREGRHRLSPYQFVDALLRSNLGLHGVSLDINAGYTHRACFTRDMLSVSKLIDRWSMLGLQIHVNLSCPSAETEDPLVRSKVKILKHSAPNAWSEETQAEWIGKIVPLLMAKPAVTGVYIRQLSDAVPHRFPHGGLIDADGHPKKMLGPLQAQH